VNTITLDKEIVSEVTVGMVGEDIDGWEIKEHKVSGEWRHGNNYRAVVHHPDHGYFEYRWQDQQNGEWSTFNDEPDPVELYRVVPREVLTTRYDRAPATPLPSPATAGAAAKDGGE